MKKGVHKIMMNIKFKTLGVPENMKIVPGVAYESNGDYQIYVCKDQNEALCLSEIYWSHLTAREKEQAEAFYAGMFCCDEEGNPDIGYGAWFIRDMLEDPDEVTYYMLHKVSAC